MPVPKTTMHENGKMVLRKNKIGRARQILPVESETQAKRVGGSAHF
jgi:hypothetical protein